MERKKNILWINYLKAICIIGVFFVHCEQLYGYGMFGINTYINPFYVNEFFFISGYLLFRKQLSELLINQKTGEYAVMGGDADSQYYMEIGNSDGFILYNRILPQSST